MTNIRSQILIAAVCLVLGVMLVTQFNTQRTKQALVAQSPGDQAAYISDLYRADEDLRSELEQLKAETAKYETDGEGSSKLVDLIADLHRLRMANGVVEVTGPGVSLAVTGTVSLQTLQDLVNELRNAGAEGIAVDGVRLITRSVLSEDDKGVKTIDGQPIAEPYRLDAIGDAHTLAVALQRKGGLIAQIMQSQGTKMEFSVEEHTEKGSLVTLPKSAVDPQWSYASPLPPSQ